MNDVIELLQRHRSIRKFKPAPLTEEQTQAIFHSAQMASTSSNLQAYSVVVVSDPQLKKQLADLAGDQAYVAECGLFVVWCADLYRLREAVALQGAELALGMENFIVATVDVALAAQNAAVAAEALGLGICYIGGIRNNPRAVTQLLRLPELVYPVFGMCIGVPDQEPELRPRFETAAMVHENTYRAERVRSDVEQYDREMQEYYLQRSHGKINTTWSGRLATTYKEGTRKHMRAFLAEQKFQLD